MDRRSRTGALAGRCRERAACSVLMGTEHMGAEPEKRRREMPRYLLVVNFEGGVVDTPPQEWEPEEIAAHLDYYKALHEELVASGELVDSEVLAGPDLAKIVTSDGVAAPVVTDGPFQE